MEHTDTQAVTRVKRDWKGAFSLINLAAGAFLLVYCYFLYLDLKPFWLNPHWTTDDALQQIFSFHAVYHPEIFRGDLIAETMKGYLAPLHYWICYFVTWLVSEPESVIGPILMGHWVMLLQLALTLLFLFLAVKRFAGIAPALFSATWLLHTRPVFQRITCGLPRGWAGVVLVAYLYFLSKKNHTGILISLLLGCLLHPPATLIAAGGYGLFLLFSVMRKDTRADFRKPFIRLLILSPLYILVTFYVVRRPPEIGQMVGPKEVAELPEFQRPAGRFPFYPLSPLKTEIKFYGYQPFQHRLFNPGVWWKRNTPYLIVGALLLLLLAGAIRKRKVIPPELTAFFLSIVSVYFLSRAIPFKLYVPNRHLQIPMSILLIAVFCVAVWRLFASDREDSKKRGKAINLFRAWPAFIAFVVLGAWIWAGSGNGMNGTANFNYTLNKKGRAFRWIRLNTPKDSLVAGHPTHIDALQLFGMRRAFATTETAHPFYQGYFKEIKRRLAISLRAHYAKNLEEVVSLLEPEGIDYFIFSKRRFYPADKANPVGLKYDKFFSPLNVLVNELTSRHYMDYAYKKIPKQVDREDCPYLLFRDEQSAVIGVKELKEYLEL